MALPSLITAALARGPQTADELTTSTQLPRAMVRSLLLDLAKVGAVRVLDADRFALLERSPDGSRT